MSIYTDPQTLSEKMRRMAMSGTPEERSARASAAAKALWTPEYREKVSKYRKENGLKPPSRKGKKNKNPYPMTDAVAKRIMEPTRLPYKGKFRPNHPDKYDGDPTNIVYRSSLELRFMQHLDSNANVLKWQSEEFFIPYFDGATNRHRRYFVDFLVVVKHGTGTLTQLIEIKPAKQCVPPNVPAKRTRRSLNEQLTWVTNNCKWQAAREYAADRNWVFKIITDKDLGMLPK